MRNAETRNTKATSGKAMLIVLALLLLAGAGGYNYHRNFIAEEAEQGPRPFKGYADQELHDLEAAYRSQVEGGEGRYQQLAQRRATPNSGNDMLDENIAHFERVQAAGDQKRAVAGMLAENKARLREIDEEIAYRESLSAGLAVHIKRLTTI